MELSSEQRDTITELIAFGVANVRPAHIYERTQQRDQRVREGVTVDLDNGRSVVLRSNGNVFMHYARSES